MPFVFYFIFYQCFCAVHSPVCQTNPIIDGVNAIMVGSADSYIILCLLLFMQLADHRHCELVLCFQNSWWCNIGSNHMELIPIMAWSNITWYHKISGYLQRYPDSKVHGANMGPTWGQQDPGGPHVGPMNLTIRVCIQKKSILNLTLKHRETHGCVVSTVATDALVLKHQAISILSTD